MSNIIACQKLMIYSIPPICTVGSMSSTECLPQAVLVLMAWWIGRWVGPTGSKG